MIAMAVFSVVLVFNYEQIQAQTERSATPEKSKVLPPDVRTVTVHPGQYESQITAYGEAKAHYELTLTAQVAGQVAALVDDFETGRRVSKGTLLFKLEDSDYRATVTQAELDLANARLALLEEERQGAQAKAEWEASGMKGEPDSELVLRRPQLLAAQAAVTHAKAALASARKNLSQTRITAPFDALVVERNVAPGSFVQAGTEVAALYSTDRVELSVALPANDWQNLPAAGTLSSGAWPATLTGVEGGQRWLDPMMVVEVDEGRLQAYGLSLSDIEAAINEGSSNTMTAVLRNKHIYLQLQASEQAYRKAEFAAIPLISSKDGRQLVLGDVANIRDTYDDGSSALSRFNEKNSLALQVITTGMDDITANITMTPYFWISISLGSMG